MKKLKTHTSKCTQCGNNMTFNPSTQSLHCMSCKTNAAIETNTNFSKHALYENKQLNSHNNQEWLQQNHSMQCPNCGAVSTLNNFQTTATCPYCNSQLVACEKQFDGLKPDAIIPFKFDKERAVAIFKEKLKKKWLVSGKFKKSITTDEIHAYYFPSFVFDAECATSYEGRLYNETTVTKSDGSKETERSYFRISGVKDTIHNNVEIEASSKLAQNELNSIRPYNMAEAKAYTDEYVYGFSLEQYSDSIINTNKLAHNIMETDIRKQILKGYSYDGVSYLNMHPAYRNEKYLYCCLPIYRINYSFKKKKYSNVMNGQTGALGGKYPTSGLKIALIAIAVTLFIALPILLFILSAINII